MLKRIILFLVINIAVVILITIIFAILEHFFGIKLDLYGQNYISIWIYAAIIWFFGSFISLFMSRWSAKRAYSIVPITRDESFWLRWKEKIVWDTVADLAERNHIDMPEVWIYQSVEPNAFATWASKNSSIVAVSTWLLDIMDEKAIEWVVAHEMAHILNWDMVTMTLLQWVLNTFVVFFARVVANIIASRSDEWMSWLAYMWVYVLLEVVFWLLATPILMAFSRHREYRADAWSAEFVWKEKMIAWLEALRWMQGLAPSDWDNLSTMKISTKPRWWIVALYSSHPSLEDRIKALEELRI